MDANAANERPLNASSHAAPSVATAAVLASQTDIEPSLNGVPDDVLLQVSV